jgi:hypothetical protein
MHSMQQRLQHRSHCGQKQQHVRLKHARLCVRTPVAAADAPSSSSSSSSKLPGLDYTATSEPASPGFLSPELPAVQPWIRPQEQTFTPPSVRDSGTLRPSAEWYPAWMQYRRREDNYVFWQDKFTRCSLEIPGGCSRLSWQSDGASATAAAGAAEGLSSRDDTLSALCAASMQTWNARLTCFQLLSSGSVSARGVQQQRSA